MRDILNDIKKSLLINIKRENEVNLQVLDKVEKKYPIIQKFKHPICFKCQHVTHVEAWQREH